jgi:hypothetical protein
LIGDEPDSDKNNSEYQQVFKKWDQELKDFKDKNDWMKFNK